MTNTYLLQVLQKYKEQDLSPHAEEIANLKKILKNWASTCFVEIIDSGSRAKGTAISIASDVDFLISLSSNCNENNGGLKSIYDGLYSTLMNYYAPVRSQNVSFRIKLDGLEVDVTPARKQSGNTNDHWIYVSKIKSWKQTNVKKHISDIFNSGRKNEIKLLKIWREQKKLDFPSIYLEYLLVDGILFGKSKEPANLANNFWHILKELAKDINNPLFFKVTDPANSNNILSDLLSNDEKNKIIDQAKITTRLGSWDKIIS